jgi:hypothetical protein
VYDNERAYSSQGSQDLMKPRKTRKVKESGRKYGKRRKQNVRKTN